MMGEIGELIAENWQPFLSFLIAWVLPFIVVFGAIYLGYRLRNPENNLKGQTVNETKATSGNGIQPIIVAEPEISIQIDNCSWGNPARIDNQLGRIVEVALTLNVQNPPINVTDLQLYIEDGMQKFVDSSPPIPFTQENKKGCYIARFGFSYSNPNFVISNEVKKYQLRVMAMGKRWTSKEFSARDFSRLSDGDKGGSQT